MNFIIFDIEATCWQGNTLSKVQETIEIGAVKLSAYGEVLGTFDKFIRPILNPRLSIFCKELTSITQSNINCADTFPNVAEAFQDWMEMEAEDYILCSWGSFDKRLLIQDCELHDIDDYWLDAHINVKRQYQELKGLRRPRGLKTTVTKEGFEFTGIHHRGISDAENLAKVFYKYIDEWVY